jgi:broad specificity phosphatase PhoE
MILIRHGQSEFNLHFSATKRDPGIIDPRLTSEGLAQAEAAAAAFEGLGLTRILASPYTRALQTAAPIASRLGLRVHVTPHVRERFAFACDIGSPRTVLEADWPAHDFSTIEEMWWARATETEASVAQRAAAFRAAMATDPEAATTLVVSHWGFLLALTGESLLNGEWRRLDVGTRAVA